MTLRCQDSGGDLRLRFDLNGNAFLGARFRWPDTFGFELRKGGRHLANRIGGLLGL